ncbi:hypothetical protein HK105_208054 [Polyrhizophydium stewartii]|uniref:PLAC8 family protein n=1 Tax=Polyrhizophydium stewartii TaxID=2732419 RepID=A0ABR4MYZ0_9FUNG
MLAASHAKVVVVAGQQSMGPPRDWTYGLFDCFGSNRSTIRAKYNIMGDSCADCCIHTFCATCALTQEKREVEAMMAAGRN